jgi:predicted acyl esterase
LLATAVAVATLLLAYGHAYIEPRPRTAIDRAPNVLVEKIVVGRMRDGVVLRADVYRPDTDERLPALLERTPYSKNSGGEDSQFRRLAAHGDVVVVQDTRARQTILHDAEHRWRLLLPVVRR